MFDIWASGRMHFTEKDRLYCLETAASIVELTELARKGGILALEELIESFSNVFFKKALTMLVDNHRSADIKAILQNFIIAGDYKGASLLKRILITDGVVAIAEGQTPIHVRDYILASRFGIHFLPEYEKYFASKLNPENKADAEVFLEDIRSRDYPAETNLLEETIPTCDDFTMRTILMEIQLKDLITALLGSPESVVKRFFNNLSSRNVETIISYYYIIKDTVKAEDIIAAQNRILAKINELADTARIVINPKTD